jgi:hypothetical protein
MFQATIISGFASQGAHFYQLDGAFIIFLYPEVFALANILHLGNVLETTYIKKKDSKSAPLWSPVPLVPPQIDSTNTYYGNF